jgi:type IV secretory pathway VirB2 component (pilin)
MNKPIIWDIFFLMLVIGTVFMPTVYAVSFAAPTASDISTFNDILSPLTKIYNFVKYAATVLAVLYLVFAGVSFIMASNDPRQRELTKSMASYVLVGLIVVWAAPMMVNYLL